MKDGKVERPDGETTDAVLEYLKRAKGAFMPSTIKSALEAEGRGAVDLPAVWRACKNAWRLGLVFLVADYPLEKYQWNAGDETLETSGKRLKRLDSETSDAVLKYLESARACSWYDILDALNGELRTRRDVPASALPHQYGAIRDAVDAAWIVGLIDWETRRGRAFYRWLKKEC